MKPCTVLVVSRDSEGNANGEMSIECTTPDDGITAIMPMGNLPGLATALPGDITVRVATINEIAPVSASVVIDYETEQQTVTFAY
jgi:hypothetical protein